jgi:hypothetical protein
MSAELVAALKAHNDPHLPIAEANHAGHFGLLCLDGTDVRMTAVALTNLGEPYLITLAANVGPGRVPCAVALRRWSFFSVLHAVAEDREDYRAIAGLVEHRRRVLLVETTRSLAHSWLAFLEVGPRSTGLIVGMVRS